jgi:hypothetical protein
VNKTVLWSVLKSLINGLDDLLDWAVRTYLDCGGERGLMADIHLEEEGILSCHLNL